MTNQVVREYFRQRRLDPLESPVVCWHVAMIIVVGSDVAWDAAESL